MALATAVLLTRAIRRCRGGKISIAAAVVDRSGANERAGDCQHFSPGQDSQSYKALVIQSDQERET